MRSRLAGALALVALLGLLVGPPLALAVVVGWPLPTALPDLARVTESVRTGIDDAVIVKALALLAWLAWAQVALAVVVEVVAVARGRVARRLPVLSGFQAGAGRLVAGALLLVASHSEVAPTPDPVRPLAVAIAFDGAPAVPVVPHEPVPTPVVRAPAAAPSPARDVGLLRYEVRRHDTLWSIAERALGDGMRWREVRDLNAGRTMAGGGVLSADGDHIEPGWVLLLPADAEVEAAAVPASTAEGPSAEEPTLANGGSVVLVRGDSLWEVARDRLVEAAGRAPTSNEVRPYWQQTIDANRARLADPANPDLVFAGQQVLLPPLPHWAAPLPPPAPTLDVAPTPSGDAPPEPPPSEPAVEPSGPPAPPPGSPTSTSAPPVVGDGSDPSAPSTSAVGHAPAENLAVGEDADEEEWPGDVVATGLLGVAGTGIAVGLLRALRRRRRQRLRQPSNSGLAPPAPPPPELDELRTGVHLGADEDHLARLERAVRSLAAVLAKAGKGSVRPRVVQVGENGVEALLTEPTLPAAPGWRPEASGAVWVSDDGEPPAATPEGAVPTPTLVSLGRPESSGQLYLDLEAERLLAVTGDDDAVAGFARSLVLELAHSVLADGAEVVVVGLDEPALGRLDQVRVVDRWEDVADDLRASAEQSRDLLAANRWPTPFHARAVSPVADGFAPLVVVCDRAPPDESFAELCDLVAGTATAVTLVVLHAPLPGATRIEVAGDRLAIPSLDLVCRTQSVEAATVDQVAVLLTDAEPVPAQLPLLPEEDGGDAQAEASPLRRDEAYGDPPFDVLVRLLGEVEVVGGSRPLSPKQTAVVAYVALHAPVVADRIEDALWPEPTASRRKRLANTISECRSALGARHLPVATDGRYAVGPRLGTDLDLFERRVAFAAAQAPEAAIETLRGAVELLRGPPFAYRNADRTSYVWVDLENWHTTWELKATDAALRLARLCLAAGEADGAVWAAERGLLASPTHTGLTEALMEAYAARGDRLAAERVYQNHVASLEKLDIDDVAETTSRLRETLRERGSSTASA